MATWPHDAGRLWGAKYLPRRSQPEQRDGGESRVRNIDVSRFFVSPSCASLVYFDLEDLEYAKMS